MGFENANRRSQLDVPAAHGAVRGRGHEQVGAGVDAETRDRAGVTGEDLQRATSVERPRTSRAVGRAADEHVTDLHARRRRRRAAGSRSLTAGTTRTTVPEA